MKTSRPLLRHLLAVCALACAASGASASLVNGNFENGLAGWDTIGDASLFGNAPQGSGQLWLSTASLAVDDLPLGAGALNRSGHDVGTVGAANAGAGYLSNLLIGAGLDDDGNGLYAYEASVAGQVFTANAGDTLSFRYNFGTRDSFDDYAFVSIDGQFIKLATSPSALLAGSHGNTFETGYASYSLSLGAGLSHQLIFGVVDVGDVTQTSTLAVDQVMVSSVPEPQGWLMALLGIVLLGGLLRRGDDEPPSDA